MPDPSPRPSSSSRARALGSVACALGVVGVVVSVALAVGALVARSRVIDSVDDVAARLDRASEAGVRLVAAARERVAATSARVEAVGQAVRERATDVAAAADSARVQALLEKATSLADAYHGLRAGYDDAHEKVVSLLDRLATLDRMLPAVEIPSGPADALSSLDEKMRTLDADFMQLIDSIPKAGEGPVAAKLEDAARRIAAALTTVSTGLDDVRVRSESLRTRIAARADRVRTTVTIVAVALVVAFLYLAMLHAVLYRTGRRMRRAPAAA